MSTPNPTARVSTPNDLAAWLPSPEPTGAEFTLDGGMPHKMIYEECPPH